MTSEREETLRKAEKLLRQGKLDPAIAEYTRMVEDQPRDWNTRNTLGDLYIRAAKPDQARAQFALIADHLMRDGAVAHAAAVYRKILKIAPDDEPVLLNLGEISARLGLLADAKTYLTTVATLRRQRGDRAGADQLIVRLGALDPSDFDARERAAAALAQNGDELAAARHYRSMHEDLRERGRQIEADAALREAVRYNPGDIDGRAELARTAVAEGNLHAAKAYLTRDIAGDDPALLLALMEIELQSGALESAREILTPLLRADDTLRPRIMALGWTLAPTAPGAAFVCIDTAIDRDLAARNYMDAAAILQEFVTRVPGQIVALLKLVRICVDGRLEATMYETQALLADTYLEAGQGVEARAIAEDLVAREPWEHAHIDRFRRALVLLGVPDPDTVIADRLSGQGPFMATDPFMAAEPSARPEAETRSEALAVAVAQSRPPVPAGAPVPNAVEGVLIEPEPEVEIEIEIHAEPKRPAAKARPPANEPDIPLRPRAAAVPPAAAQPPGVDIDLTDVLAELQGTPKAPAAETFQDFRSEVSRQTDTHEAREKLALAKTYLEMGMTDEGIETLTEASRTPAFRFEAASILGRLYQRRDDLPRAAEWLERASEAPAPTASEGRELLFDLGATLETMGETARALAVFMELQADAGEYRDVAARVERLARVQTGG